MTLYNVGCKCYTTIGVAKSYANMTLDDNIISTPK